MRNSGGSRVLAQVAAAVFVAAMLAGCVRAGNDLGGAQAVPVGQPSIGHIGG